MTQIQYGLFRWPTDANTVSVHHLKHIRSPIKLWSDYKPGEKGRAVYPGKKGPDGDGTWAFEILSVNSSKKVLEKELSDYVRKKTKEIPHPINSNEDATNESESNCSMFVETDEDVQPPAPKKLLLQSRQAANTAILKSRGTTNVVSDISTTNVVSDISTTNVVTDISTTNVVSDISTTNVVSDISTGSVETPTCSTGTEELVVSNNAGNGNFSTTQDHMQNWNYPGTSHAAAFSPWIRSQTPHRPSPQYGSFSDMLSTARSSLYGGDQEYFEYRQAPTQYPTQCSCHEEVQTLKGTVNQLTAEVKALKKAYKSLKDGANCSVSAEAASIMQKEEEIFPTGKSKAEVERRSETCQSLTVAVKEMMPLVFTIEELTTCTLKGQKSGKSSGYQRPPFESARKDYLIVLLMKKFDASEQAVQMKMRNRLKILRNQYANIAVQNSENTP